MDNTAADRDIGLEILTPEDRSTAVVVQTVPLERSNDFIEWQRCITTGASQFPGYKYTEVYRPAAGSDDEWVTVVHFESNQSLEAWIQSPARQKWVDDFKKSFGDFTLKRMGGFDAWFSGAGKNADQKVPGWKMVLTVVFALYPTVMLLSYFLTPFLKFLPFSGQMLVGNFASVCFLQWVGMPVLTGCLSFWLRPSGSMSPVVNLAGLAGIVAGISLLLWVFIRLG